MNQEFSLPVWFAPVAAQAERSLLKRFAFDRDSRTHDQKTLVTDEMLDDFEEQLVLDYLSTHSQIGRPKND